MKDNILNNLEKFSKKYDIAKQEGTASFLMCASIWVEGFCGKYFTDNYKTSQPGWFWLFSGCHGMHIFDEKAYSGTTEEQLNEFVKNKNTKVIKKYFQYEKEVKEKYSIFLKQKLDNLSNSNLRKEILAYATLANKFSATSVFCEAMSNDILIKYHPIFGGEDSKLDLFMNLCTSPIFESIAVRRDKLILKYLEQKRADYKKIQWIFSDYFSTKRLDEIPGVLKSYKKSKLLKEINSNKKQLEENISKYKEIEQFSLKIRNFIQFSQVCMKIRDNRRDAFSKLETILYNYVQEYFKRLNLNENDIIHSFYPDFKREQDPAEYSKILQKRKKGVLMQFELGEKLKFTEEFCDFDSTREKIISIIEGDKLQNQEIKGQIASKGKSLGRVSIMLSANDFKKFKKGDVIVASMTRPDYVPLMKEASAIITDEGGITCHAAIVAREL